MLAAALTVFLPLAGCGDDGDDDAVDAAPPDASTNDVEPRLIPGGGAGDGAVRGEINVFVIDDATDEPIAGATVRVGADHTGTTDATGLLVVESAGLEGPQTVTAAATGYSAATWIGVNAANVTLPLSALEPGPIATATVSGTITGWDDLPDPPTNHITAAMVTYSFSSLFGADREGAIAQGTQTIPGTTMTLPANMCIKVTGLSACDWELATRTGQQFVVAFLIDIDTKGTSEDTDDTMTFTGFAAATGLDLAEGAAETDVALAIVEEASLADVTVAFADLPSGLTTRQAFPVLDQGDEGILPLFFVPMSVDAPTAQVPSLGGGTIDLIGRAATAEDGWPETMIIAQDVTAGTVELGAWLPLAGGLSAEEGSHAFTSVTGAAVHAVDFEDASGTTLWSVVLLDGSTSFTLPALTPDPLPAGEVSMIVNAVDVPAIDLGDFALRDVMSGVQRQSRAGLDFTH